MQLGFARDDTLAVEGNPAPTDWRGCASGLQQVRPVLRQGSPGRGQNELLCSRRQDSVRLGRPPLGQLVIERGTKESDKNSDPSSIGPSGQLRGAIGVDEEQGHEPIVGQDGARGKWHD